MKWKWCNLLLRNNVVLQSFSNKPWGVCCDGFIKLVSSMANGKALGASEGANPSRAARDLGPPGSPRGLALSVGEKRLPPAPCEAPEASVSMQLLDLSWNPQTFTVSSGSLLAAQAVITCWGNGQVRALALQGCAWAVAQRVEWGKEGALNRGKPHGPEIKGEPVVKASQDSHCQLPGKMPEILADERQALPVYSSVTIPQSLWEQFLSCWALQQY